MIGVVGTVMCMMFMVAAADAALDGNDALEQYYGFLAVLSLAGAFFGFDQAMKEAGVTADQLAVAKENAATNTNVDVDHTSVPSTSGGSRGTSGTSNTTSTTGKGGSKSHVHGNSKASTKTQHGYEIYNTETNDVIKTGISGQKLNRNGTSPRANSQVNKLNKSNGSNIYAARVVKTDIPNRAAALEWEKENAMRLWSEGNSMQIHKRPQPWR